MNEIITDFLAQHFITLPFVSRAAGCVTVLRKPKSGGGEIKIPVAQLVYKTTEAGVTVCDVEQDYQDLIPVSTETGILYFEDLVGAKVTDSNKRYNTWEGRLKLVFWANLKKIGQLTTMGDLETAIIGNLPQQIAANGAFFGASVRMSKIFPKRPSPFDYYNYNEVQTQFLAAPYGYFSLEIAYTARASRGCPTNITLNPELC